MVVGITALELGIAVVVLIALLLGSTICADNIDIGICLSLIEAVHELIEVIESLGIQLCDQIAYMVM